MPAQAEPAISSAADDISSTGGAISSAAGAISSAGCAASQRHDQRAAPDSLGDLAGDLAGDLDEGLDELDDIPDELRVRAPVPMLKRDLSMGRATEAEEERSSLKLS